MIYYRYIYIYRMIVNNNIYKKIHFSHYGGMKYILNKNQLDILSKKYIINDSNLFLSRRIMNLADIVIIPNNFESFCKTDKYIKISKFIDVNNSYLDSDVINNINNSNIFFLKPDYVKFFKEKILNIIKKPFKLVTHCSDIEIDSSHKDILDNKLLLKWFAQNVNYDHPKLISIPIGIEDLAWNRSNISHILRLHKNCNSKKDILLYISSYGKNNKYIDRQETVNKLIQNGFEQSEYKPWNSYMEDIHRSKFVFCPWGNGIDTHRFWETYAVNSIPIILKNYFIPKHFSDIKMLVIDDINQITPEFLEKKYNELNQRTDYNYNYLNLDYWKDKINE